MKSELVTDSSAEVVVTKRKRRRLIVFLVMFGCFIGWQFFGDAIREVIDRTLVRNVRYVSGETVYKSGTRPGSTNRLILPSGQWVKVGSHVKCYGRSMSHHGLLGLRSGYSYVQVNGKVYGKPIGPCTNYEIVPIAVDPMDSESVVTVEMVVQGLEKAGFHLIEL